MGFRREKITMLKNNIEISYDGKFPNLCRGNLIVTIDGIVWKFPSCCLKSGGTAYMHEGTSITTNGEWYIRYWPDNFPEELKQSVLEKINKVIPGGCCGRLHMKKDFEVNFENKDLEKEIEDLRMINLINKNIDILLLHKIPNIEKNLKRKEIKDQVKAVLTEDLGVDRDYIRNLCNELVEQAVKTQFEILITNGFIKRIVIAELDKLIKDNKWNGNSISSLVLQAAKQEVSEFVKNNLKFGPSVTDDTNN